MDVAFGEDDSRIRTGYAAHRAVLKRIAHNLQRQDWPLKVGIAKKRLATAWNKDYLYRLIGPKPKPSGCNRSAWPRFDLRKPVCLSACGITASINAESPAGTGLSAGHGTGTSMPNSPDSTAQTPDTVHRTVRLRLYPGDAATGILLTAIAGACRHVWNHMLADCEWRYARWQEMHVPAAHWPEVRAGQTAWAKAFRKCMGSKPSVSYFTLCQRFTELRNDPDHAWLKEYPSTACATA